MHPAWEPEQPGSGHAFPSGVRAHTRGCCRSTARQREGHENSIGSPCTTLRRRVEPWRTLCGSSRHENFIGSPCTTLYWTRSSRRETASIEGPKATIGSPYTTCCRTRRAGERPRASRGQKATIGSPCTASRGRVEPWRTLCGSSRHENPISKPVHHVLSNVSGRRETTSVEEPKERLMGAHAPRHEPEQPGTRSRVSERREGLALKSWRSTASLRDGHENPILEPVHHAVAGRPPQGSPCTASRGRVEPRRTSVARAGTRTPLEAQAPRSTERAGPSRDHEVPPLRPGAPWPLGRRDAFGPP